MGKRTGRPRGRPKGSLGKARVAFEEKLAAKAARVAKLTKGAFKGDAHDYLMSIYKDPKMAQTDRIDAAKAALAYEKPKLSAVQMSGNLGLTHEEQLEKLK